MITALNRFISRSADRYRPFYLLINKWKGFEWSEDCTVAFQQLKEYLLRPPIMFSPATDEVLYAYITVAPHAVSLVLLRKDNNLQRLVYYVSKSLPEAEIRYSPLEKAILAMAMVQKMGGKVVEMFSDSRLVVGQVKGEMEARDVRMQEYLSQVKRLRPSFDLFSLSHISRSGNTHADSLATLATSSAGKLSRIILVEHLSKASKVAKDMVRAHEVKVGPSWMDPIVTFLKDDILPEGKSEAEKVRRNTTRFWLSEDHKLYKHSYSGPYLLCVHPEISELLLKELHEGIYGSHTRGRSLSHRAFT